MNGATTLVAISDVPSGSLSISGRATSVKSSFWKKASGTKHDGGGDDRAQQPVAQLEQVRDQRAFGERFGLTRALGSSVLSGAARRRRRCRETVRRVASGMRAGSWSRRSRRDGRRFAGLGVWMVVAAAGSFSGS